MLRSKLHWPTLIVAAVLLPACATTARPPVRDAHHYSHDTDGNRVACYATAVAKEYECYPLPQRVAHHHHHHYDPWWPLISIGLVYSWHHHPHYGHRHHGHRRR